MAAIESDLAWPSHAERSPSTVRAYALDLKLCSMFLEAAGLPVATEIWFAARAGRE